MENGELKAIGEYAERFGREARRPGFWGKLVSRFVVVWSMITRIPLPRGWFPAASALPGAEAMVVLPLVGGVFGFVATLPASLLALSVPPVASAWIACGIYTLAGWSLHLDGWGDLWDGVGSGKRGEGMRRVMKDSRSGTFGVAGIVLAISIRASLLSVISVGNWLSVCIVAGGVGRFAAAVSACVGEYPWSVGMGREFVRGFKGYQLFCSFLAACLLFPFAPAGWTIGMLSAGFGGAALALWANKNLGGVSGDILGAASVLGEILVLIGCTIPY